MTLHLPNTAIVADTPGQGAARKRPLSLQARQLLAASLGLVAFLGLTGLALDRAFVETAQSALHERLRNYSQAYLAGLEFTRDGQPLVPAPPDERFAMPGQGLYARISGRTAAGEPIEWESESTLGQTMPPPPVVAPGQPVFEGPVATPLGDVYRYAGHFEWVEEAGGVVEPKASFTLSILEHERFIDKQITVFRQALWINLGAGALMLLALQVFVLRWSLRPLRRVVRDLVRVESGVHDRLAGSYPRELAVLTDRINAFVEGEREHLGRYRNTLADLAHSLKTPLAVLRSRLETSSDDASLRTELRQQVARMDEIVAYQLQRAATSGHQLFAQPLALTQRAEEIVRSLEKVYADKHVLCEFEIESLARFYGEEGDLMELLGNLLENAFKWCRHRVLFSARSMTIAPQRRAGLLLVVEDDGPGIPPEQVERVLQRGVRGDERVHGHGIGLAIVQDIVRAYRGELSVERSEELGGARFVVRISPSL
jgi:two-component system sensor histidine kinase PhoQ